MHTESTHYRLAWLAPPAAGVLRCPQCTLPTSLPVSLPSVRLPDDFSPPSRFVRAAFFRSTAPPLATPLDAVSQAFHILNNFDIPIGVEFGEGERMKIPDIPSATQWTAVSDLASRKFYYKTMRESAVKRVDLNRIDFASGAETAHALDRGTFTFEDVTPTE